MADPFANLAPKRDPFAALVPQQGAPASPSVPAPGLPPIGSLQQLGAWAVEQKKGRAPDWLDQFSDAAKDVGGAVARGVTRAGQSLYDLAAGGLNLADEGVEAVTGTRSAELLSGEGARYGGLDMVLPGQARGPVAQAVEPISQFVAGFALGGPLLKAAKVAPQLTATGQAFGKGALADFLAFSGADPRVSDVIQSIPALRNPLTAYLASDPKDSEIEGRLKNTLEGMGLGGIVDGLIRGVRAYRARPAA